MKFKKLFNKSNRRKPRANAFMLESLEPRLLLSAAPMTAAVVTTDHLDYAPGETAVITTANSNGDGLQFGAGELVRFQVSRTDGMADHVGSTADVGPMGNEAWYVTDGVGGFTAHLGSDVSGDGVADWIAPDNDLTVNSSISTSWFVEEQYRNSSLVVTAAGQESGAVATQSFTDANVNTSTVVTATAPTSVYGSRVDFTATVTAAVGATKPVGSVEFFDGTTSLGIVSLPSGGTPAGVTRFTTNGLVFTLSAGTHQIHAVFTGGVDPITGDSFNNSASVDTSHTVTQKGIAGSFTAANKVYDGTNLATVLTTKLAGGILLGDDVSLTGGTATFATASVGANKVVTLTGATLTGASASNYTLSSLATAQASITKANATVTGYTGIYDGLAHGASATGVLGETLSGLSVATHTNAGIYNDTFTFTDVTGNYNNILTGNVSSVIAKANATIATSGFNGVYDGVAHTATATATGVLGESLSGLILSATPHTNVGNYNDGWTFTDVTGNYNDAVGAVSSSITALGITGNFTAANKTYDATTAATVQSRTLTGVIGADDVSLIGGTGSFNNANAGTGITVTLTGATLTGTAVSNYSLTSVNTTIANITALGITGNFTAANKTYDATTAATVQSRTLTGVIGLDDVSLIGGTASFNNANAGANKTVTLTGATLTGAAVSNYSLTSVNTTTANIAKATAILTVTGYLVTYDGAAHQATGTATGVLGESLSGLNLSVTSHTNAGLYRDVVTFTDVTGNYVNASKAVRNDIVKANATIVVTGYNVVYNGLAHQATGTATGVLGESLVGLNLSGTTHTNVGTGVYSDTVTFTDVTGNYRNATKLVTDRISKANATITLTGYNVTYDGAAHQATGTATGVLGESLSGLDVSGTTHTNVGTGTYSDTVIFTDVTGNYRNATKLVTDHISKANATIVVTGYNVLYNGLAHQATATATGVLGESLVGLNLSGTTHTNVGTGVYSDTVTFTDVTGNYRNATKLVTDRISKANATITLTGYNVTYDGAAHQATGTATGVLGESLSGLDLSGTTHTNVGTGTYSDTVTFIDVTGNYRNATKLVTDHISKANITFTVTGYAVRFDGAAHTATATTTGVLGESLSGIDLSGTTHTTVGAYVDTVTFTDVTGNYKNATKLVKNFIV